MSPLISSSVGNSTMILSLSIYTECLMKGSRFPSLNPILFMFNMFIDVPSRTSTAVRTLKVDALAGQAYVTFTSGYSYAYGNVSKRAILNVLFNPDISLGFWVNHNLVNAERTYQLNGDEFDYKQFDSPKVELPAFV